MNRCHAKKIKWCHSDRENMAYEQHVLGTVTQFLEEIQLYPKKPHQYMRLKLEMHEKQSQRKGLPLVIELLIT